MEDFVFHNATRIVFGRNAEREAGRETRRAASRILLHSGQSSAQKSGLLDRVRASLREAGVEWIELPGAAPNPRLGLVREGIRLCRERGLAFVLAVGGGSVIDSAKAIAIGAPYDGDVWDFFDGRAEVRESLPVGAVLTIPAAGSEASSGAVITREEGGWKRGAGADCMRPVFALLNPELTFTLPPYQTACGVADMMAHIFERYFTRVPAVDLTDRLCEAALRSILRQASLALARPDDYDARAELMWAGTLAHNDLLGTGRIGDWASHDIEHELSGLYDVVHGAGLAVVFPAWMRHVCRRHRPRFVQFAERVWDVEPDLRNPDKTAHEGIARLEDFFRKIGLPVTLKELGVPAGRLEEMAARCTARGPVGCFESLGRAEVLAILKSAAG